MPPAGTVIRHPPAEASGVERQGEFDPHALVGHGVAVADARGQFMRSLLYRRRYVIFVSRSDRPRHGYSHHKPTQGG